MSTATKRRRLTLVVSVADARLIDEIVERYLNRDTWTDHMTRGCVRLEIETDLTACHANGNELNLAGLLNSNNDDFFHDVEGIRRNLDRYSGDLMNCFSPRYSA